MSRRAGLSALTMLVLLAGLVVTVTLAVAAKVAYEDNEDRLLEQNTQEAAAVLQAVVPTAVAPLQLVATLVETVAAADDTVVEGGIETVFQQHPLVHLSVWTEDSSEPRHAFGDARLEITPDELDTWFADVPAAGEDPLRIVDLLDHDDDPRVGYVYSTTAPDPIIVYAERPTPPDRRTVVGRGEAFDAIDFILYLGPDPEPRSILSSSDDDMRLGGRTASEEIELGDTVMLLTAEPDERLGGNVLARLPWQVAVGGLLSTLVGAFLVELLHRGRRDAQSLAAEVEVLYGREHDIAQTLQHSLLPRELPPVSGAELAVRYIAGAQGTEVGGDWYDVIPLDDRRLGLVVGDVAGKGVQAAAVMAAMRYGTHAIAAQGMAPDRILSQINHLEGIRGDFVTMVCGVLDLDRRTVMLSRAGHPPPLLVEDGSARFLDSHVGPPVGFLHTSQYATETVQLAPGATLLLFTDGVYERPGEDLDVGLERLRSVAAAFDGPLQGLVDHVCAELVGDQGRDDVALLAVRLDPADDA